MWVCWLFAWISSASTQSTTVPPIVERGFEEYESHGVDSAYHTWLANSPISHDSTAISSAFTLHQLEKLYGRMEGHEIMKVSAIGSRVLKVYAIAHFQRGPLYMWFECYRAGPEWIISAFLFNPRPEPILPTALINR